MLALNSFHISSPFAILQALLYLVLLCYWIFSLGFHMLFGALLALRVLLSSVLASMFYLKFSCVCKMTSATGDKEIKAGSKPWLV